MATQLWNQEIDKTVDWSGDTSTGGNPVSGQFVQKFIKDTLAKKFGYLNYDKASLKYQVFADYEDYVTWNANPIVNANLLLATFDAPAPASIIVTPISSQNVTILSSDKNQKISFNYHILDSSSMPMNEAINVRILFNNGGNSQVLTLSYDPDYDGYNKKDENGNYIGTTKTIDIDEYLAVGTNNITVTLTGASSQAQTSVSFKYTVVELSISSLFDNSKAFEYDSTTSNVLENFITIPYKCSGQGSKYIEIYINGEALNQSDIDSNNAVSFGSMISSSMEYSSSLYIFMTNKYGQLRNNLKEGKNNIQFRIFIEDADKNKIYSQTLYFDFIVREKSSTDEQVYILYRQTINNKDQYFKPEDIIEFSTQQYSSTSFDYSVYSSTGKEVQLNFDLAKLNEDNTIGDSVASLVRSLNSGVIDTFEYSFMTYGKIQIKISAINPTDEKNPYDTMLIVVEVDKSDVQIAVDTNGLILNLEALNRSNSEPEDVRNQWVDSISNVKPVMKNVYFNSTSGWDGKALVLNNGATIEIPYNIFGIGDTNINNSGLTFELTFEMINVQDEDTTMVSFKDVSGKSKSSIQLTASEARISDNSLNEVYTKFNSNTKIKMAFVVCPYDKDWEGKDDTTHNANFICVNGILDKADMRSASMSWTSSTVPNIVIGDETGKAGIKLYSLRVYNKALSLDEELTNWIAESDDLLKNYKKNTLNNNDWTGKPSMDVLKQMIPTILIYGDIDKFNSLTGKKENLQVDMEFYDPTDDNRDFYARGMWMSPQGTSSMSYPIKNMRPYFSKTRDNKTKDDYAEYYTEVYHKGQFVHGEVTDESTLGHFYTNKKTTKVSLAGNEYYMHKCYNKTEAEKLQGNGEQLFFKKLDENQNEEFIPCVLGVDDNEASEWYVAGYREVIGYNDIDTTWKVICDLRLSGQTLYKKSGTTDIENKEQNGKIYHVDLFKKLKGKDKIERYDENGEEIKYYIIQGVWKQYDKSGYTNVWTLKADYAESSMCNNAGTGRLWGDVMKNFMINGEYVGKTNAQKAVQDRIDIRTSCDGKPVVVFCMKPLYEKDEEGKDTIPVIKDGVRQYSKDDIEYVGLYNIMTDKSSTPLFGFENIYDENGNKIYDAVNCECWECLSNAVDFPQGLDIAADKDNAQSPTTNKTISDRQPLWAGYEVRWPDVDGVSHSHKIESLWRFINFCKDAVDYKIGGVDGYDLNPYVKVNSIDELDELWNRQERPSFAIGEERNGNMSYDLVDGSDKEYLINNLSLLYYLNSNIDYNNITKTVSTKPMDDAIYIGKVPSWDAKYGRFIEGIQFDDERVSDVKNNINYGDEIADSPVVEDYYISVYLTKNGAKYEYIDNYGIKQTYSGTPDDYEKTANGESWRGKTKMEYFSEKKYDWFNVYRLAAYYIYLMRFAAVDQVVKNSMLTTEDGQHFYYINYDNDTIFGVRNDGNLVYHWNINRNTYDYQSNAFAFAGAKSVLWNLLENDEDFMAIVKQVDNAMFSSKAPFNLSASNVLNMYNNKQEGTWGERLYNFNEQIKYLSQWNGSDAKYLKFIHGSSNQYRSWFVENRFNLYDSLWESGEYLTTKMTFYMDTNAAGANKLPMFNITAARENKFFLSNVDGLYKDVDEWKKELKQNETASWPSLAKITGISSPWMIYGSDKIKVLDFRPSIGIFELQKFSFIDGYDWPTDKGCLMTGFLIGDSDEYREKTMYRYTNVSSSPATFMSTKIDPENPYISDTKLSNVPEGVTETEIDNGKWEYSSTKSITLPTVILNPNEYYDSETQKAQSENFIQTIINPTVCGIASIGGIGKITSLEEIDIRNCFNSSSPLNDTLDLSNLSNLHIFRAIGSSITSFEPAVGCNLSEVSLPNNRISKLALNNVTFIPSYDDNGEMIPMLKYTPDAVLRNLTLKNVTMADSENPAYDVVEFINTWISAYTGEFGSLADLKNLSLTLEGVDITVDVEWLRKLKELDLVSFTGNVFVIGSDNGTLTQEEFDELNSLYSNERPFEVGSSLRFSAYDAVFWTVNELEKIHSDEGVDFGSTKVYDYYEILHGETLKFRSTKFKDATIDTSQNYTFHYVYNNSWQIAGLKYEDSLDKYIKSDVKPNKIDMYLTVKQTGMSEFISRIGDDSDRNVERFVKISTANNDQKPEENSIYVKIKRVVNPSNIVLYVNDPENEEEFKIVENNSIELSKHHESRKFLIRYENSDDITVNSTKPTISLSEPNYSIATENKFGKISDVKVNIDNRKLGSEFVFTPNIQPTDSVININITAPFESSLPEDNQLTTTLKVKIKTIVGKAIEIINPYTEDSGVKFDYNANIGEYEFIDHSTTDQKSVTADVKLKLTINSLIPEDGYKFPIKPYIVHEDSTERDFDSVNVPILKIDKTLSEDAKDTNFINEPKIEQENGQWYLIITANKRNNDGKKSYDAEYNIYFTGTFGYDEWDWESITPYTFEYAYRLDASIIYPTNLRIEYEGIDISSKALNICTSDGGSKEFQLSFVSYNNEKSDPVTVEPVITLNSFELIEIDGENTEPTNSWWRNNFAIFDNETKKLTLNKYRTANGETPRDEIHNGKIKFVISASYTNLKGENIQINNVEIFANISQSLASYSKIDDCEPYKIGSIDKNCPWYFVDKDNQYYEFNSSVLDTLIDNGKLYTLVGIARRMQYGFGELANEEVNGNPYNNASEVWENDPQLIEYKNGNYTRKLTSYYRPLCIPLFNWKVDDTKMKVNNEDSTNWKNDIDHTLNETYGSWAVPRYPLIPKETIDDDSNYAPTITAIKGETKSNKVLEDISIYWSRIALHTNNFSSNNSTLLYPTKLISEIKVRSTAGGNAVKPITGDNVNLSNYALRLFGSFDIREATKAFCKAELPEWYSSNNIFTDKEFKSFDKLTELKNIIWPGYSNIHTRVSGLLDVWHHFNIYNEIDELKHLRCYPASLYELDVLFNGNVTNRGTIAANKDSYKTKMTENIPSGIYELKEWLNKSGCLDKLSDTFVMALMDYFGDTPTDTDIIKSKKTNVFGSFYCIPQQASTLGGDSMNCIGFTDDSLGITTLSAITSEELPGRQARILMIPLLYVD